ncbi:MAG: IS21 family transposase, partial [Actinomycetota bacterium]|nr:IS21 family transposase [Actinomycetota bacterium]
LTAAVKNLGKIGRRRRQESGVESASDLPPSARAEFQKFYRDMLVHYGIEGRYIRAGRANENGDVEQSHHRLKRAIDQELMLRGSRDFASRAEYEAFLRDMFIRRNAGRRERFEAERRMLRPLPPTACQTSREITVHVSSSSLVRVLANVYSVDSRLIGEYLKARIRAELIELFHGQRLVQTCPRLIGKGRAKIDYRHVIRSLVRKPGAFAEYRYREELFPNLAFRLAYDRLRRENPAGADREYLRILEMAALDGEEAVKSALEVQATETVSPSVARTRELLERGMTPIDPLQVEIVPPELAEYDRLHSGRWVA